MGRKVTVAPQAAAALQQARLWLTQKGSGRSGQERWQALRAARVRLQSHPYLGHPSAEIAGCRQLVVSDHRIVYRVENDTGDAGTAGSIRILTVFGPGQA